ncbi:glutathione S-transferase family protein [Sphingomonas sp. 35-24ZXX]|uniref:glutathione S-transferase family protein n=1 Tax=Sphingomonas sp. 35-24ZXX TaxID=1545915 RepID=UPI00053BF2EF|nr:glutathione S-transferase family protein [Sphingomonas sp. 35-24ZXX]
MKLYQSIGPNPRVVLMFLEEKGAVIDRAFVDIMKGENRGPDFLAKNPFGQLPLLEMDDGTYLSESTAICGYIEEKFPTPALIGSTAEERAVTQMLVRRLDYDVVAPMTTAFRGSEGLPMFQNRLRCLPEAADGLKACARDGLAAFDALLAGKTWLAGDRFTLADIMLYCLTEFGNRVGQPTPDDLSNIKAWSERVAARPSAAASLNEKTGIA